MCNNIEKTTELFKNEVDEITNGEYELIGEYITNKIKVKMKHNICQNEYFVRPDNFIKGSKCPYCSKNKRVTESEFIKRFIKSKGNDYKIISKFINTSIKIKVRHKCGYEYEILPSDSLKYGCAKCAKNKKRTTEEFKNEVHDIVGNEYTILNEYNNTNTKILFKHNCNLCNNFEFEMIPKVFLQGQRCPSCNESKGEKRIQLYLIKNSIKYKPQKTFDELVGIKNRLLSYDFYLSTYNLLIEYQGEFHDGTVSYQTKEQLMIQQEHDRRKKEYAELNNIKLLEIWYWDFYNIEEILNKKLN